MPKEKNIYGRISQKIDTEANWLKAVNFIPNKGEIIIYEKDASHTYDRIKIGDGVSNVNDLPFSNEFIKTINGKEPDGNGNIKIRTPYEVVLSHYEGLTTAFNRTPQQIIEAERGSDKEVIYKLYIPIVTDDSETGPDIYATEVELKNVNENYNSYTGYQIVVKFGEKYPPIIIDGSTDSFYIDETWVAPTTPSDIPDTTNAKQYLVTNNKGEKVWTNLPITETIRIDLTDATRIMPDVIQNYSALTPAEMIQKGRSLAIYNLVFYREIRDHVGNQMGVVVDLVKDRGYKAFTNENGDYCLRIYFDNYAPIIIDATKENPFYLDPEYVAPEPIIPETSSPNQYLTTNAEGEKVWEDKIDIAPLQSAIDTLNGTGEGSVRDIVADSVATIVANAPEDFDTLKEVADWISNDTLGTADLLQRMTTAEEKIVALDVQADWNQTDESAKDFILNKPVPITNDEIDAICGGDLISENILVDTATGDVYRIYVENGKLSMEQADVTSDATELVFIDGSTDVVYKAYVEDGKLCIMEAE